MGAKLTFPLLLPVLALVLPLGSWFLFLLGTARTVLGHVAALERRGSCSAGLSVQAIPDAVLGSWGVTYPEALQGLMGSCVVIPCTFSYPSSVSASAGIVAIWYKDYNGQKTVVYHSAAQDEVDDGFRNRTRLLGDPAEHNCTLLLWEVTPEDSGTYRFRFEIVDGDRWSAEQDVVLMVSDVPERPTTTANEEVSEGAVSTFVCSTPYACPFGSVTLSWRGYNAQVSSLSTSVQLDTGGVNLRETLTTSFSWKDQSKKLLCEVSLGSKKATGEVVLRVRHAPKDIKVSMNPSTRNVRVGDTVSFTCTVNSSYPPIATYRWYKDGMAVADEQILTIQQVRREDYGRYHCEAKNSVGSGVAPAVTLYVFSAEISISPEAEVREGTTAVLSCNVPGRESWDLSYTWYKNSMWLKEGPAHSLVFHDVAVGDAGYYSCKVQNDLGSVSSQAVSLSVTYPPRTPTIALFQEAQDGKLAIVHCTVDSHPEATMALYHDGSLVATTQSHAAPNQRLSITTSRNSLRLEIRAVVPADSGEYRCTASNAYGNATAARPFTVQTARVLIRPSAEVREGDAVTLTCQTTRPAATYAWYKNGKWLAESSEAALLFPSVGSRDAGAFHCRVRSAGGDDTSAAVSLHVLFPPRLPVMSSFLETQGGHLGIIQCTVESDPEAQLTLRRGEEVIACTWGCHVATNPRVQATSSYNSLKVEIHEVVLEDEGTYVCLARNPQGNASASMDFTAETAQIQAAPSSRVLEGQAVNLTCGVSSDSPAPFNFSWYRNGRWLAEASAASLVFRQVASADAGLYSCKVTTERTSRSSAAVSLDVLYPPRGPQVALFLEMQRGRLAIFQCSVESNPSAQLDLYKGEELVASSNPGSSPSQRIGVTASPNALRVEIRGVTLMDEGSYRFVATNAHGTVSHRLYFRVQTARVLVVPSTEVKEGDHVSLTCDLLGEPLNDTIYSWYKNSKQVQEGSDNFLALPYVSSEAMGSYHCKAHSPTAASTSISPSISLRVFYPPHEPVLTSFLETSNGQLGILQCTVDSNPPAELALFKGDVLVASTTWLQPMALPRLSVSSSLNSLRVQIRAVVMEDEGEYVCLASNTYGNASTSRNFTAGTARVWISPSPDVREGDAVNLTCAVASSGRGALSYTWYKDNVWFSGGPAPSLTFPKVAVADAASYHCVVQTPEGSRSSSPSTLNVLYPPRNLRVKAFLEAGEGRAAILTCTVESNPPAEITLRKAGELVASSPAHHPAPNTLRLELGAAAAADEGDYECSARSPLGSARASQPLRLQTVRVVVRPAAEVPEGTGVTLTCEDSGAQPDTVYTWYKNARWLAEGPAASLVLAGASREDAGTYSCQARSGQSSRWALPTALRVLYGPRDVSFTSFLESQGGRQAVLHCTVDSYPPSAITLRKGSSHAPLASTQGAPDPRLRVHASPNSLRVELKAVEPEDEGLYICSASNGRGVASASAPLATHAVQITVEPSAEVPEGAAATLTCSVAPWAGQEANFTWFKNGQWLQEGGAGSLTFTRVSSAHAGSYHCQAAGARGTAASAPLSLSVTYPPRSLSVRTFLENRSGRVGIVVCTADSQPPAALALYRRGHLLATSGAPGAAEPRLRAFASYNTLRLEIGAVGPEDAADYTCVAGNAAGNATATSYFDVRTLSYLLTFTVLAGLLAAVLCAAALAFAAVRLWPRMRKLWDLPSTEDTLELNSKQEQVDGAC
ncbi:sialoadhesin isoform X2 [Struthio camelus]|uniref:sialoadhesin isoform X2 n=1 Tax=Struthio camelus TaxID=8801 RepID=UPI003603B7EC